MVEAPTIGNQNVMRAVVERGGHSTYRIFVSNSAPLKRFPEFWLPLEGLGCTVERATERLFGSTCRLRQTFIRFTTCFKRERLRRCGVSKRHTWAMR